MMKRFSYFFLLFAVTGSVALGFQNCGTYTSGINPLTDSDASDGCQGASCAVDLSFVEIMITNTMPIGLTQPLGNPVYCDASTCFDLAGVCNTAGLAQSFFYYQWSLNGVPIGTRIATGQSCDAIGRFHLLVQIPPASLTAFDYKQTYTVDVTMTVIDQSGNEQENPSIGVGTKSATVTGI